jgi:hypothetical protein
MLSEAKLITDIVLKSGVAIVSFLLLAMLMSRVEGASTQPAQNPPAHLSASAQLR